MKKIDADYVLAVGDIPDIGFSFRVDFNDAAKEKLADRLNLISVTEFKGQGEIHVKGRFVTFAGNFTADVVQSCVISLNPVSARLSEDIHLELVSEEEADARDREEAFLNPDEPEYDILQPDRIVPGEILAQTLSMALNPYPRCPDASLEEITSGGVEINQGSVPKDNPFAALQDLAKKK